VKSLETLVPDGSHLVADEGHRLNPPAAMIRVMTDFTARSTEGYGGMTDGHVGDAVAGTALIEYRSPATLAGFCSYWYPGTYLSQLSFELMIQ